MLTVGICRRFSEVTPCALGSQHTLSNIPLASLDGVVHRPWEWVAPSPCQDAPGAGYLRGVLRKWQQLPCSAHSPRADLGFWLHKWEVRLCLPSAATSSSLLPITVSQLPFTGAPLGSCSVPQSTCPWVPPRRHEADRCVRL